MLTAMTREEAALYLDFAYALALDRTRSDYPTYTDGIKTKEDFIERTFKAFDRENEEILLFTLNGDALGWIHYYVLPEDDYMQFCAFNIAEHPEQAVTEFIAYAQQRHPRCKLYFGLPEENVRVCAKLRQLGFVQEEYSLVSTLDLVQYRPAHVNSEILHITAENFSIFAAIHAVHDEDMYWNNAHLQEALEDWQIYLLMRDGKAVGAIYFTCIDDFMEIFGVDYADGVFCADILEPLLLTAISEGKKLGCRHLVYFYDEQEHPVVQRIGFADIGGYVMYARALSGEFLLTYETNHYVFHYENGSPAQRDIEKIAAHQEACYTYICSVLGVQPDFKLHYHLCNTPDEVGAHYGDNDPCNGFARKPCDVYAVYNDQIQCIGFHEDAHLISYLISAPVSAGLREGLAVYFDRKWWGIANEEWAAYYLHKNSFPHLRDLFCNDEFFGMDCTLSYPIVGFITDYLIHAYGMDAYMTIYKQEQDTIAALESVCGKSICRLDREIREYLILFRQDTVIQQRIEALLAE